MDDETRDFDDLWDYQHPEETEKRFRSLLERAGDEAGVSYRVELLTQIARTQGLQERFDAAHQTLDQAEKLLEGQDFERATVRYLLERGRVFNSAGSRDRARPYFVKAWERAVAAGEDYYAADAAHMMGIVEPLEEGIQWNRRAFELAEKSEDPRVESWLGPLYNNNGWSLHDLGRYEEALDYFEKSLQRRRAQGQARETRIAAWTVGRALRSLGRTQEALTIQLDNLQQARDSGDSAGYVEEELGECLLAMGHADEAAPHFARAHTLLSQDGWLVEHEPGRLKRLWELAQQ
jgi:tetratricopeptide (TPR) repeat protein